MSKPGSVTRSQLEFYGFGADLMHQPPLYYGALLHFDLMIFDVSCDPRRR
jgi:hypothetical protein